MQRNEREQLIRDLRYAATNMRRESLRMTTKAGSGHATTSLSAADLVAALFFHELRYDIANPRNPCNDRFVLSKGHGSPILYAAWAQAGAFPADRLQTLRRIDSDLEGHPTPRFRWADVATGSLGQGLSIGVGMALAAKHDDLDSRVFVLMGDGETAEGAVWEAAALAAHHQLDNLIGIVDVNRLGQSDPTMLGYDVEAYARRFRAFGWHTVTLDGHDFDQILDAFEEASGVKGKPVMLVAKTVKGKGVSFLEDQDGWHGKALSEEELEKALAELPLDENVPELCMRAPEAKPSESSELVKAPMAEPDYNLGDSVATRAAYGSALKKLGDADPRIVAVDGDVKNSTMAEEFFEAHDDRSIEGFIAEQNMVGMAVGLQALGKIPFVATFACFLTRAFDVIRMAAISRANIKFCGSHAGVSIGEDGPSQMGLEDLAMMRTIPGGIVLYPCDAVSTERMVELAAAHRGISYLRTTRPKTPLIYPNDESFVIGGSKVVRSSQRDQLTIVAAGITLHEALTAHDELQRMGIQVRVVDLYSVKPIDRATLLDCAADTNNLLLTVEDHYPEGGLGEAVASAVAPAGVRVESLAVRELPRSGAADDLLDAYEISSGAIARAVKELVSPGKSAAMR